jgi:hypothetical protein
LRRGRAQRRIGKFIANARTEVNRNKNETHYRVPTRPGVRVKRPGRRSKKIAMAKRELIPQSRYVVEPGVPIPKSKREIAAVLEKMKVGDSFSIVHETTPKHLIYSTAYLLGMKVRIRARRVWRTK